LATAATLLADVGGAAVAHLSFLAMASSDEHGYGVLVA